MKLINTNTLQLEEFIGSNIPRYAILSHTWEEEELSFSAFGDPRCMSMKGYDKIRMTCLRAAESGLKYAWVDTCSIDKTSSAELSEAINSMYRWYQRADVCYAYLSDLESSANFEAELPRCRWFTRGWTLQELIAPTRLFFFDKEWNYRGSKEDLVGPLANVTGIHVDVLRHTLPLSAVAVAQKMSWAARRQTTRREDMAYCLLGIFDVNLPLLYGEEDKAFRRLQEEIIRTTADLSIFAWTLHDSPRDAERLWLRTYCGPFARSTADFASCARVSRVPGGRREFSVSNNGVKLRLELLSEGPFGSCTTRYVLPLDCSIGTSRLGLQLRKCGPNEFLRQNPWELLEYTENLIERSPIEIHLLSKLLDFGAQGPFFSNEIVAQLRSHALQIKLPREMHIYDALPWSRFDEQDELFFMPNDSQLDSAAARICLQQDFRFDQRKLRVKFEFLVYTLGWSSLDPQDLQISLVDFLPYRSEIMEMQSELRGYDHNRRKMVGGLIYHNIPMTSRVVFPVSGTEASVVVGYIPSIVDDPAVCRNQFWRIELCCQMVPNWEVSKVGKGYWIL